MGPLLPQGIINGDLNFFFALIIGIAFGFILEQAGFSSSRKLAGVFYGYDFVVLKVFFTAAVTAATGLFFLKYMGWINFEFLYVNPLYLWSAIVGGVIMGFGFILGGFCPGTSLTAAVIGKIDAWFFIGGMLIGVFIFGYFYPVFKPLHMGSFLGSPFIYDTLGLSQQWFLFLLVLMAVMAFAVTQLIENSSKKFKELLYNQKLSVTYPLIFILILSFIALWLPQQRNSFSNEKEKSILLGDILSNKRYVNTEKIAHTILNNEKGIYLIDVRTSDEYNEFHLPGAVNLPLNDILSKESIEKLTKNNNTTVLYSNGSSKADMAWFFASRHGIENLFVLNGGLNKFYDDIFTESSSNNSDLSGKQDEQRFIKEARAYFREGKANDQSAGKSIPNAADGAPKAVKGGC